LPQQLLLSMNEVKRLYPLSIFHFIDFYRVLPPFSSREKIFANSLPYGAEIIFAKKHTKISLLTKLALGISIITNFIWCL